MFATILDRQTGLIKLLQYVFGYASVCLSDIVNCIAGATPKQASQICGVKEKE